MEALAAVCPNEGCIWTGTIKEFEVCAVGGQSFELDQAMDPPPAAVLVSLGVRRAVLGEECCQCRIVASQQLDVPFYDI